MFKYLIFLSFCAIVLVSCDGQDRIGKTNVEILEDNKLLDSFSEHEEYIPKLHVEINTDTVLNNGFRIQVKYHRHIKDYVSKTFKKESIKHVNNYYDFGAKITVFKDSKEIFKKDIYKYSLEKHSREFVTKVKDLIMQPTYIDYEKSINNEKAIIVFPLCSTDNKKCISYQLTIDAKGIFNFKEID